MPAFLIPFEFQVEEAEPLVRAAEKLRTLFFHIAPNYRIEALQQVQEAENIRVPNTFALVH